MLQIAKGGKFVYGWSLIREDLTICIPGMAVTEYDITSEQRVILISGSKKTGGFSVSRRGLLTGSVFENIFNNHPQLKDYTLDEGEPVIYKGRYYTWLSIGKEGMLKLTEPFMKKLSLI